MGMCNKPVPLTRSPQNKPSESIKEIQEQERRQAQAMASQMKKEDQAQKKSGKHIISPNQKLLGRKNVPKQARSLGQRI